ncbi:hypothetical protein [Paenibacillus wynnii]|uniref:Uncharacterized protein n=1 Tax=Paenibacillus wynnii TaxID=268407 RepID=A0A098MDB4_9BACL|nr:hypothetical protein [Paenibacillus wynnii]KGE20048.1 hypothetical protein PWYN_12385 [Paenibacillus wynnii]
MGNTPIPSRAIEYSSTGTSGVREYTLTPEQLEEVRRMYPATKRDKTFKKPVAHNHSEDRLPAKQRNQKPEEDNEMSGRPEKQGPNNGLTKQIFLEQIASGETVASIEKAWGMKYNTLSFWVKKWDVRGIDAAKAQELLAGGTPKQTQLLREKEAQPGPITELEQLDKALQEIEELKAALSATQPISHDMLKGYKAEAEHWKAQATEVVALAGKAAEESMAKIEQLQAARRGEAAKNDELRLELDQAVAVRETAELDLGLAETRCVQYVETIDQLATQCDGLQEEVNRLITERDDLVAEVEDLRDDIRRLREIQTLAAAPPSDAHLLDRSIADLTRARWILERLSASGE